MLSLFCPQLSGQNRPDSLFLLQADSLNALHRKLYRTQGDSALGLILKLIKLSEEQHYEKDISLGCTGLGHSMKL
ncbi:MAG: hypothetical protein AAF696_38115, partial [Bacteroidota bacterium]